MQYVHIEILMNHARTLSNLVLGKRFQPVEKETRYEHVLDSNAEQIIEWEGHKRQELSIRNRQTTRPRRQ